MKKCFIVIEFFKKKIETESLIAGLMDDFTMTEMYLKASQDISKKKESMNNIEMTNIRNENSIL